MGFLLSRSADNIHLQNFVWKYFQILFSNEIQLKIYCFWVYIVWTGWLIRGMDKEVSFFNFGNVNLLIWSHKRWIIGPFLFQFFQLFCHCYNVLVKQLNELKQEKQDKYFSEILKEIFGFWNVCILLSTVWNNIFIRNFPYESGVYSFRALIIYMFVVDKCIIIAGSRKLTSS